MANKSNKKAEQEVRIDVDRNLEREVNEAADASRMQQMVDHDANPETPPEPKDFIEGATTEQARYLSVKSPAYLYHNKEKTSRIEQIDRILPAGSRLEVVSDSGDGRIRVRFDTQSNTGLVEGYVDPELVEDVVG